MATKRIDVQVSAAQYLPNADTKAIQVNIFAMLTTGTGEELPKSAETSIEALWFDASRLGHSVKDFKFFGNGVFTATVKIPRANLPRPLVIALEYKVGGAPDVKERGAALIEFLPQ